MTASVHYQEGIFASCIPQEIVVEDQLNKMVVGPIGKQSPEVNVIKTASMDNPIKPNKPTPKPQKTRSPPKVRFLMDADNEIVCQVNADRLEMTKQDKELMWWSSDDASQFKRRAKRAARVYQKSSSEESESDTKGRSYTAQFKRALETCSNSSGHLEKVPLISNTPARGLENYIFPEIFAHRRDVVRTVLKAQEKIPEDMSSEHRVRLLNATSKCLTRPMRRLSRVMAIGDARVASAFLENVEL
jgi:hypothetical protein